ncbi:MAG: YkgJ family cysteine cluster protein [Betaproteobacteria bacterium]|nr:YkgJ family cysteine cluster protein [Betaproteobacteria bacterium]
MNAVVNPEIQATFERERAEARARKVPDAAAARQQTVRMYGRLADLQADIIRRYGVKTECERGCAYCCHLRVEIRPHEAFVLANHIQNKLSVAQREQALARIEENLKRISPLSAEQHIRAGIPCALLQDGACSVYEGRPATCRKYYSVSVDTCRAAFQDTAAPLRGPIEDDQVRLAGNAVALGYAKGMEEAGLDAAQYELHFALHRALTNAKTEKRYRDGKKAFI